MGDWVKSLRNPRNGANRTIQADSIPPGHFPFARTRLIQPWKAESNARGGHPDPLIADGGRRPLISVNLADSASLLLTWYGW